MVSFAAASLVLIAGTVLADSLATITPCIGCPSSVSLSPITISSQYQAVSTCVPTTSCGKGGLCQIDYPFETFVYISTVIPAAGGSTTITKTDQPVTISRFRTTVTHYSTPAGRRYARPTPVYSTIGQDYVLPYNKVGPLAVPGYGGSGLCTECEEDGHGARRQHIGVTECTAGAAGTRCVEYTETLLSTSAPSAVSTTAAACSTSFDAPSAGTYTFTFSHTATARTITAHGHTYTVGGQSFNVYASQYFGHRGPHRFHTTVTATITQTVPVSTLPATVTHSAPVRPVWNHQSPTTLPTSCSASDPTSPTQSASSISSDEISSWLDWKVSSSSPSTTSSVSPALSDPSETEQSSISASPAGPTWSNARPSTSNSVDTSWPETSPTSSSLTASLPTSLSSPPSSTDPGWPQTSISSTSLASPALPQTSSFPTSSADPDKPWLDWTSSSSLSHGPTPTSASTSSISTTTPSPTVAPSAPSLGSLPPTVSPIYITVALASARYRKRTTSYLSFSSGGDAILVSSPSLASTFDFYRGYLLDAHNGEYVGTDATQGSAALEEFRDGANLGQWSLSGGGSLGFGGVGFCYTSDEEVFVVFDGGQGPSGCVSCVLGVAPVSSTTTTTTTTTTSTSTTTTTSPIESATLSERELESQEMELERRDGVGEAVVKRGGGVLRRH